MVRAKFYKAGVNENLEKAFLDRVSDGSLDSVQYMMRGFDKQINVNRKNSSGETPLIIAAKRNDFKMVEYLLKVCHADPTIEEPRFRTTAESYALENNNVEMLNLIRSKYNNTPSVTDSEVSSSNTSITSKTIGKNHV